MSHDEGTEPLESLDTVLRRLPHRAPFLLLDALIELEPRRHAVAVKAVRTDEPFLAGHFPEMPVMPGVLLVEALAQTAACMMLGDADLEGHLPLLAGVEGCRFRRLVRPGDNLRLEVTLRRLRGKFGFVSGVASVEGVCVAEADLSFTWLSTDERRL